MYISRIHIVVMILIVAPIISLVISSQIHLGEVKSKYSNLSLFESLARFERDILALKDSYQKKAEQIGESKQIKRLLERWDVSHDRDEIQASLFSETAGQIELFKAKKIVILGSDREILTDSDNYNHFGELHKDENTERAFKGYSFFILNTAEDGFLFHYEIPVRTQKKILAVILIDFIEPKEQIKSLTHLQVYANESFFLIEPSFPLQDTEFFKQKNLAENLKEILKEQGSVTLSDGISYFVRAQKTLIPNASPYGMLWIAFVEQDKILKPFQLFNLSLLVAFAASLLFGFIGFVYPFQRWLKGFQQIRATIVEAHTYDRKELPNNFKDHILKDVFDLCLMLLNPAKKAEPFSLKGVSNKPDSDSGKTKANPEAGTAKAAIEAKKNAEAVKASEPSKTADIATKSAETTKPEKSKTEPAKVQSENTKEPAKSENAEKKEESTKAEPVKAEKSNLEAKKEEENPEDEENHEEFIETEINYEKIYEEFVAKKKELGENSAVMNFETFQKQLMKNLEQLKKNHPDKVINFSVIVKDKKVSIQPKLRKIGA